MRFDFHGVPVEIESEDAEVGEELRGDFRYFEARVNPTARTLRLGVSIGSPDEFLRAGRFGFKRPEYTAYGHGRVRWIDYQGQAAARWDYALAQGFVVARTRELAHEIAHLAVLSRVGEEWDRRGLHRVHALGVAQGKRGALVLMPSGGGKSVLAMEVLRSTGLSLLSDDTPIVSNTGRMLPLPLKVGLLSREFADGVPENQLSRFPRRGRPTKTMVSVDHFYDRVPAQTGVEVVLLGRREGTAEAEFRPVPRRRALKELADALVVGRGVAQMSEYILRANARHLGAWAAIAVSRTYCAARIACRAQAYEFRLSGNSVRDARALEALLSR